MFFIVAFCEASKLSYMINTEPAGTDLYGSVYSTRGLIVWSQIISVSFFSSKLSSITQSNLHLLILIVIYKMIGDSNLFWKFFLSQNYFS